MRDKNFSPVVCCEAKVVSRQPWLYQSANRIKSTSNRQHGADVSRAPQHGAPKGKRTHPEHSACKNQQRRSEISPRSAKNKYHTISSPKVVAELWLRTATRAESATINYTNRWLRCSGLRGRKHGRRPYWRLTGGQEPSW